MLREPVNQCVRTAGLNNPIPAKKGMLEVLHEKLQVIDKNMSEVYLSLSGTRTRLKGSDEVSPCPSEESCYQGGHIGEIERTIDGIMKLTNAITYETDRISEI